MDIVVDTSVIIAVIMNESSKPAIIARTTGAAILAPSSLHWEVGNALSAMLKRKRATLEQVEQAIASYHQIQLRFIDVDLVETLEVASWLNIYAYDAYFILCARSQKCPLLAIDGGLRDAAKIAGINVLELTP